MLDLEKKTLLVSIRRISEVGEESFDTFFADVMAFDGNTVRVKRHGAGEMSLPYDEEVYVPAEPGFYELKNGTTFENPDFVAEWTVFASEAASVRYRHLNL
jgi:hypothetical protein